MALILKDRVRESTITAGTGTLTLDGAVGGFQGFSAIGDGNTTYYAIVDVTTGAWEVGVGTYTLSGQTLSRDAVLESSSGGTLVDFTSNIKDVFCTYPAEQAVTLNDVQTLTNKTLTAPVISTISNTGTLTLPTSTDTLVGRATTDTLTNKTLTSPVISGGTINNTVIGGTTRAAGSFTTLDANGNVVLGDATADTISANGRFNTDVVPSTTDARDLGTTTLQWKQVYATTFTEGAFPVVSQTDIGTAPNQIPLNQYLGNLAYQNADAIAGDLQAGSINNTPIGATTASTGAFTNLAYTGTLTGGTGVINIGSGQLYKDASGNVGIGTSSPFSQVQIDSTNNALSGLGDPANYALHLRLPQNNTGEAVGLGLGVSDGSGLGASIYHVREGSSSIGYLAFGTRSAAGLAERMRITSAGNVGIGTSSPGDKLEIGGAGAGIILASPNGTRYRITVSDIGVLSVAAV